MKDYYKTLGIERNATDVEIKKAFRKLALECHPDRNSGDKQSEERFKEVNEAYSCLCDPQKRAHYDRFGTADGMGGGGGYAGGFAGGAGGFGDIFEDFFGEFFGGAGGGRGAGAQRRMKGNDLRFDMEITLEESAFGTEKVIDIMKWESCTECKGTGSISGRQTTCRDCGGRGQVRFQQGFFSVSKVCSVCKGAGTIIQDPCKKCEGEGKVRQPRQVSISIPAGVDAGSRLKLTGEGDPGLNGGPAGDLYVVLDIAPHEKFQRDGQTVYSEAEISFAQATLGAEIEVPTLDGPSKLKIPAGTQPATRFSLKGKGIPRLGSRSRGDHVVIVSVTVPRKLSSHQKELLEEFERSFGSVEDDSSGPHGIKDKLKNLFTASQ